MTLHKIKSQEEIGYIIDKLRVDSPDLRLVTTNGSYDLLHAGHVHSIEEASALGDKLVVLVNSDASVRSYKAQDRPIIPEAERARLVAALEVVDFVVVFDAPTPNALFGVIKPDFHVKSRSGFTGVDREDVEVNGGRIVLVDDVLGCSTTNIIDKIRDSH